MRAQRYGVAGIAIGAATFGIGLLLKESKVQGLVLVVAMLLIGLGVTVAAIARVSIMTLDGSPDETDRTGGGSLTRDVRRIMAWNINADRWRRVALRTNYACFFLLFCPLFALKCYMRITGDFQARWAIIIFGVPILVLAITWVPAFLVSLYFAFRKRRVGIPLREALATVSLPFSTLLMCIPFFEM